MTNDHRRIATVATGQLGAFSRQQAHAAGLSDGQLRRRVQSGILEPVGANAFRSTFATRSAARRPRRARPRRGRPGLGLRADRRRAARVRRLHAQAAVPPHLAARSQRAPPRGRRPHHDRAAPHRSGPRTGVRGHQCGPHGDRSRPLRTARGARSGRRLGVARRAWSTKTCCTDASARSATAVATGSPRCWTSCPATRSTRGGHSWLERRFLRLLAEADLPAPSTQQVLTAARDRLVRVDCRFPGTNVVVELLGYRFHSSKPQLRHDAERLNALVAAGAAPYQFTYEQVVEDPAYVVTTVRGRWPSLRERSRRPPRVCPHTDGGPDRTPSATEVSTSDDVGRLSFVLTQTPAPASCGRGQ